MGVPSREDLLAKAKSAALPREVVKVPEFECDLIVQGMTGADRDAWELSQLVLKRGALVGRAADNLRARLVVRSLVYEDGTRMFTDADADAVGQWRSDVLDRLCDASKRVNGLSEQDMDALGKSSAPAAGSGSSSSSV